MKLTHSTAMLSAALLTLTAVAGPVVAQSTAQTPLSNPVQVSGSVTPSRPSNCGVLADSAAQVLQVQEDFTSINIAVNGSAGLTLFIQGPGGFTECHTTSGTTGTINAPGLMNQGSYSFFIGNSNPVATSYTLTLSQN